MTHSRSSVHSTPSSDPNANSNSNSDSASSFSSSSTSPSLLLTRLLSLLPAAPALFISPAPNHRSFAAISNSHATSQSQSQSHSHSHTRTPSASLSSDTHTRGSTSDAESYALPSSMPMSSSSSSNESHPQFNRPSRSLPSQHLPTSTPNLTSNSSPPASAASASCSTATPPLSSTALSPSSPTSSSSSSFSASASPASLLWFAIAEADSVSVFSLVSSDPSLLLLRGPVGETPLLLSFLYSSSSPAHRLLSFQLLSRYPHLVYQHYQGGNGDYEGENLLHIAILQKDEALVEILLNMAPDLLFQPVTGAFFSPGSPCYYGDYPLAFAATTNQLSLVRRILECAPKEVWLLEDRYGNNILHHCVLHNRKQMYVFLKQEYEKRFPMRQSRIRCPKPIVLTKEMMQKARERKEKKEREKDGEDESMKEQEQEHEAKEEGKEAEEDAPTDLWHRMNHAGHTPFTLAAYLGRTDMFSFLIEESKLHQWQYGSVKCVLYPLDQLDIALFEHEIHKHVVSAEEEKLIAQETKAAAAASAVPSSAASATLAAISAAAATHVSVSSSVSALSRHLQQAALASTRPSALELIVNHGHIDLLMLPIVRTLISTKWDRFASRIFFRRFLLIICYLLIFTYSTIFHPLATERRQMQAQADGDNLHTTHIHKDALNHSSSSSSISSSRVSIGVDLSVLLSGVEDWIDGSGFLLVSDVVVWGGALLKAVIEMYQIYTRGWKRYIGSTGSALLENTISISFLACLLLALFLNLASIQAYRAVLALGCVIGWCYLLFFLLAFPLTGPLILMIYRMLWQDVVRFLMVYSVFLCGFSLCFYVLLESTTQFSWFKQIEMSFVVMLGNYDMNLYKASDDSVVSVTISILYVTVITILLLNLLIAMMGDTFRNINEHSEQMFFLERARILCEIEQEMPSWQRKAKQNQYWTELDGKRYLQINQVDPEHWKVSAEQQKKQDELIKQLEDERLEMKREHMERERERREAKRRRKTR